MKVDIITSNTKAITFNDLEIGDTFYDYDGDLAIKTNNVFDDGHSNGIYFNGSHWVRGDYDSEDEVTPVDSVLKVGTDT